ncbi:contractile injection system protein, VgrG/Pvc8 family [Xenorhabdus innexi]|uniref:Late control gene D protein n=1 Tax=Xenorhabdus innexi TaxID=290109 RepID=A0A1N6MVA0_9GAMM|nr:contractile injection system protein, VgrG/Pvc8 family [Xenorhabdus innexi]PHM30144.1 phage protein [Xenorhabdus innexi]SIP72707.1 Late control gene D protein [Xenorhabdus innexi]
MMDFKQWMPNTDWIPQFDLVTGKEGSPAFRLEIDNKDITGKIQSRLMSLSLTDNRGLDADQLDIELDDADGKLKLPSRGDILTLKLGWHGHPLTPKGQFIVDEVEHVGAPDRLTIRARSVDLRGDLNVKREWSYHKLTLENIVSTIAMRNQLSFKISDALKGITVHIDQTDESDVSFLTRVAKQEGAIVSVKNNELLFIRQGENETGSGMPIAPVKIIRKSGDNHRFTLSDRESYTGVIAQWLDTRTTAKQTIEYTRKESKSAKVEVSVQYESSKTDTKKDKPSKKELPKKDEGSKNKDKEPLKREKGKSKNKSGSVSLAKPSRVDLSKSRAKTRRPSYTQPARKGESQSDRSLSIDGQFSYEEQQESAVESHQVITEQQESRQYLQGSSENVLTLSRMYSSKEEAERAAEAAWKKLQRNVAQFSITLAKGRAELYPEMPVHIKGFKPEIDGTDWTIVKVTHNLNDSGFTTSLDLEVKLDEVEIKPEAQDLKINT